MLARQVRNGCDVVDIARLSDALDRRPALLDRVFTATEVADARRGGVEPGSWVERSRLAARFAAKEAARKALGDLSIPFHETEIRTADDGAPELWIRGERSHLAVSLSHDGGVAMAFVVSPRPGRHPADTVPVAGRVGLDVHDL